MLRAFREHSNQTLHSNHAIFQVCVVLFSCFTQQVTILEILVLRVFREHFHNYTLEVFQLCVHFVQIWLFSLLAYTRNLLFNNSLQIFFLSSKSDVLCFTFMNYSRQQSLCNQASVITKNFVWFLMHVKRKVCLQFKQSRSWWCWWMKNISKILQTRFESKFFADERKKIWSELLKQ